MTSGVNTINLRTTNQKLMIPLTSSQFLERVWPSKLLTHEMLELRVIRREDGSVHREFLPSIPQFLERAHYYKDREVYFGVSTRFGEDGTRVGCYRVNTLWCDLDGKRLEDCNFKIRPDILVNSGGGVHAYWLLVNPVLVRGERWDLIENRTRWLAKQYGGDTNTCDVARILRCPGEMFYNHKYESPRQVRAYTL